MSMDELFPVTEKEFKKMQLTTDKKLRKAQPIARGVLDYFGNALAEVAHVSFVGNQQHNPGESMHWARGKSTDHADCIARHLIERGTLDDDGLRHTAKAAWRALALLQIEIEDESKPSVPQDSAWQPEEKEDPQAFMGGNFEIHDYRPQDVYTPNVTEQRPLPGSSLFNAPMYELLHSFGVSKKVADQIVGGHSTTVNNTSYSGFVYVAGPMRGHVEFNFPAFDIARNFLSDSGWHVISPADIDRAAGDENTDNQLAFCYRDFMSLFMIAHFGDGAIAMLPGWEHSTGAAGEFFLARWLKLKVLDATTGKPLAPERVMYYALSNSIERFLKGQLER